MLSADLVGGGLGCLWTGEGLTVTQHSEWCTGQVTCPYSLEVTSCTDEYFYKLHNSSPDDKSVQPAHILNTLYVQAIRVNRNCWR